MGQLGLEAAYLWDAGIIGNGFTHHATAQAPQIHCFDSFLFALQAPCVNTAMCAKRCVSAISLASALRGPGASLPSKCDPSMSGCPHPRVLAQPSRCVELSLHWHKLENAASGK